MRRFHPPRPGRATALASAVALLFAPGQAGHAADPQPYAVTIQPTGNAALDTALHDSSTLVSLRESAPVGAFALIGRAQQDGDRFATALQSFGYYEGSVTMTIAGRPLNDPALPDLLDRMAADSPAEIKVTPTLGPLFHLGRVAVDGPVPAEARAKLDLAPGAPAVASDVVAARVRLLSAMRDEGYALAKVDEPVAYLQPATDTLDVTLKAESGPRVDLGPITVEGLEDVNASYVDRRLMVHQGEQFNPGALDKARQDLIAAGVFSSVVMMPADKLDAAGQLPVTIKVTERPQHAVSFGAAYSTDLGVYGIATWSHRNLFGNAEQLNLSASFTGGGSAQPEPGYSVTGQFLKPDFYGRDQQLQIDLGAVKQTFDAYDQKAIIGDILFNKKFSDHWSGSIGVAGEIETIKQQGISTDYTLIGLPVTAKYDSTNSLFEPTQGIRATLSATPTESLGTPSAFFTILQASGSTYIDMPWLGGDPGRSVLALRGLVGTAQGADQFDLPPDKRFYAGGSATVRGYKFQSVGPRFRDGDPQGGLAVSAATVEFRQRILESFGFAVFADAGQVSADSAPFTGTWSIGAGLGARYYTPIGPIRVDFAVPLQKRSGDESFQIYIGIGQAF